MNQDNQILPALPSLGYIFKFYNTGLSLDRVPSGGHVINDTVIVSLENPTQPLSDLL